jgi:hypothetical protein
MITRPRRSSPPCRDLSGDRVVTHLPGIDSRGSMRNQVDRGSFRRLVWVYESDLSYLKSCMLHQSIRPDLATPAHHTTSRRLVSPLLRGQPHFEPFINNTRTAPHDTTRHDTCLVSPLLRGQPHFEPFIDHTASRLPGPKGFRFSLSFATTDAQRL